MYLEWESKSQQITGSFVELSPFHLQISFTKSTWNVYLEMIPACNLTRTYKGLLVHYWLNGPPNQSVTRKVPHLVLIYLSKILAFISEATFLLSRWSSGEFWDLQNALRCYSAYLQAQRTESTANWQESTPSCVAGIRAVESVFIFSFAYEVGPGCILSY